MLESRGLTGSSFTLERTSSNISMPTMRQKSFKDEANFTAVWQMPVGG